MIGEYKPAIENKPWRCFYKHFLSKLFSDMEDCELWILCLRKLTIAVNAPLIVGPCQLCGMPCLESSIPDTLKRLSEPEMERERRRSRRRLGVKPRDRENI